MKKLLIYTNKEYCTYHIVPEEKVFETLMNLLKYDLENPKRDVFNSSLDKILEDNDISFECLSLDGNRLPEGVKLTAQKTEYYND